MSERRVRHGLLWSCWEHTSEISWVRIRVRLVVKSWRTVTASERVGERTAIGTMVVEGNRTMVARGLPHAMVGHPKTGTPSLSVRHEGRKVARLGSPEYAGRDGWVGTWVWRGHTVAEGNVGEGYADRGTGHLQEPQEEWPNKLRVS